MRYLMIQAGLFGAVAIMSFLFSLPYGIALAVLGLCLITIPFTAGYSTPSRYGIYLDDAARAEIRYSVERAQYRMSLTLVNTWTVHGFPLFVVGVILAVLGI